MFSIEIPAKIHFGRGCFADAVKNESNFIKNKRILLVTTGRSLKRLGYLETVKEVLSDYAQTVTVFESISANPRLSEVKEGISLGKNDHSEVVVGFGGGSAMDAAKAVAAGIGCEETVDDMFFKGIAPSNATLPIIAVPTTAGTGSELSKGAILTDDVSKIKSGIRGANLYPRVAIVDSYFTEKIPLNTTLETGFDVFAHAVESYVSKKANAFSEQLSLQAIDVVSEYLPRLMINLGDTEAREKMSYASMIMGINLGNVGTALPHRLQYPIGALTDTSHAAGLIALYPAWIQMEYKVSSTKMTRVSEIISKKTGIKTEPNETIDKFINSLGTRRTLTDLGKGLLSLDRLMKKVSGNLENDPAYKDTNSVKEIYEASM